MIPPWQRTNQSAPISSICWASTASLARSHDRSDGAIRARQCCFIFLFHDGAHKGVRKRKELNGQWVVSRGFGFRVCVFGCCRMHERLTKGLGGKNEVVSKSSVYRSKKVTARNIFKGPIILTYKYFIYISECCYKSTSSTLNKESAYLARGKGWHDYQSCWKLVISNWKKVQISELLSPRCSEKASHQHRLFHRTADREISARISAFRLQLQLLQWNHRVTLLNIRRGKYVQSR
jgi:hypothetical protein